MTEGDRGCALQLQFPGPMTWSALADGHVPKIPHLWGAPKFPGLQLVPVGLGSGTAAAGGLGWVWTGWGWVSGASLCDPRRCLPGPVRYHIVKLCMQAHFRPSDPNPAHIPALPALPDLEPTGQMGLTNARGTLPGNGGSGPADGRLWQHRFRLSGA